MRVDRLQLILSCYIVVARYLATIRQESLNCKVENFANSLPQKFLALWLMVGVARALLISTNGVASYFRL